MARRSVLIHSLIFVSFCFVAVVLHRPGFHAPMVLDSMQKLDAAEQVFARDSLLTVLKTSPTRPVATLSFYANFLVSGMSPAGFRVVNAFLSAFAAWGVYLLLRVVLSIPGAGNDLRPLERSVLAGVMGAVFLVHPAQTFVVLYIVQRMALLACMFSVFALVCYLGARTRALRPAAAWYGVGVLTFLLALFSKENAIVVPLVVFLIEVLIFRQSGKQIVKPVAVMAIGVAVVITVYTLVIKSDETSQATGILGVINLHLTMSGLDWTQVPLTQARVFWYHLATIFAPFSWEVLIARPFVVSSGWFDPPATVFACAGMIGLIGGAFLLCLRRPMMGIGILFFLAALIPESIAAPQHMYFGHRLILPLVGVLLTVTDVVVVLLGSSRRIAWGRYLRLGLVALAAVWLGAACGETRANAKMWADHVELWARAVDSFPADEERVEREPRIMALNNLGDALFKVGRYEEATRVYREALKVDPQGAETLANLGVACLHLGRREEAARLFEQVVGQNPPESIAATTYNNLGNVRASLGMNEEAVASYRKAVALRPYAAEPHVNLGALYLKLNRPHEAREEFATAVALKPNLATARANLGLVLELLGQPVQAATELRAALALNPKLTLARVSLASVLAANGDTQAAIEQYQRAVEQAPQLVQIHEHLAGLFLKQGDTARALAQLETYAGKVQPDARIHVKLGSLYLDRSDYRKAEEHFAKALALRPDSREAREGLFQAGRGLGKTDTPEPPGN